MEELDLYIEPELEFSLKKCGDVVPYGITPEERAKLAGIEENANNYTHPEKHPASILDVVDVVNGDAKKFLNERGEMVAVAHESLTDKNSEAAVQHVDTTVTKPTLDAADMVAIKDSVTGKMVLTPKSNLQTDLTTVNQSITNLQNNKANKTQEAWITPTLLNGWVQYDAIADTAKFYKDDFGCVHIKGWIAGGLTAGNAIIFILPLGYRPPKQMAFTVIQQSVFGRIEIRPNGEVFSKLTNNTVVQIDNISFRTY